MGAWLMIYSKKELCKGLSSNEIRNSRVLSPNILGYKSDDNIYVLRYGCKNRHCLNHNIYLPASEIMAEPDYIFFLPDDWGTDFCIYNLATYDTKAELFKVNISCKCLSELIYSSCNYNIAKYVIKALNKFCPMTINNELAIKYIFPVLNQPIFTKYPITINIPLNCVLLEQQMKAVQYYTKRWIRE